MIHIRLPDYKPSLQHHSWHRSGPGYLLLFRGQPEDEDAFRMPQDVPCATADGKMYSRCRENGIKKLWLQTRPGMPPAGKLYYKMGFKDHHTPAVRSVLTRAKKKGPVFIKRRLIIINLQMRNQILFGSMENTATFATSLIKKGRGKWPVEALATNSGNEGNGANSIPKG